MGVIRRVAERADMMTAMMRQTGVDLDRCPPYQLEQTIRAAVAACQTCGSADACKHWLAGRHDHAEVPGFCPNAQRFAPYR